MPDAIKIDGISGRLRRAGRRRAASMRRMVVVAVLLLTAGMPAAAGVPEPSPARSAVSQGGRLRVVLRLAEPGPIPIGAFHTWVARVNDAQGQPVEGARITVGGGMEQHGHGLPTEPQVRPGKRRGEYRIEGVKFTMAGEWTLLLVIQADGWKDTVPFRLDVDY